MAQYNRRQALLLAGGLAAATASCSSGPGTTGAPPPDRLRIGLLAPLGGPLKAVGEELANGFRLYLEQNGGRLGGSAIDLVPADEGDTIADGVAALRKLLGDGVAAVAGVANSALLAGAAADIDRARVPVLAANGVPETLQGATYLWATSYAEHEPGVALGPLVARQVAPGRAVAVVAPSTASGDDAVNGFKFAFGPADRRIRGTTIRTPAGTRDFTGPVGRILRMDAAAVYCTYAGDAATGFVRALRAAGSRAAVFGPGGLTDDAVLAEVGERSLGIRTAQNYSADLTNEVNKRFTAAYRRAHGHAPSAAAVGAYDAAHVIDRALRLGGAAAPAERIYFGLDAVGQVESPRGVWQFNLVRTPLQRWYLREVRRDGTLLSNVTVNELTTLG
ncbi:ABC transporter substrate-binding protein [Spirilliplanes yamanashiensis]|uniref:Amino acid-binding protein n=1 Tax=Spirilliplanes yamanashiensis TaxID=42233 RepID=A0A8J4DI92_9ACTN|nr:ABC transporter substrate-binding protein [Spirilliplanes yamanashiensis]MDP9814877.1 branched-chain amino acid transport system substrate-binding protein [Spirilliplanes yamanashiensis]GIJ02531.1 amino acid-binding protein [Spirilliplanes yamanashiensis]